MAKSEGSAEAGQKYYGTDGKFHWSGESSDASDSDEKAELARKKARKDKSKKHESKKKHAKIQAEGTESEHSVGSQDYDSASYSDDVSGVWSVEEA